MRYTVSGLCVLCALWLVDVRQACQKRVLHSLCNWQDVPTPPMFLERLTVRVHCREHRNYLPPGIHRSWNPPLLWISLFYTKWQDTNNVQLRSHLFQKCFNRCESARIGLARATRRPGWPPRCARRQPESRAQSIAGQQRHVSKRLERYLSHPYRGHRSGWCRP